MLHHNNLDNDLDVDGDGDDDDNDDDDAVQTEGEERKNRISEILSHASLRRSVQSKSLRFVPTGSSSRDGDVTVCVT